MLLLMTGLLILFTTHSFSLLNLREPLLEALGRRVYFIGFSCISLFAFYLIAWGFVTTRSGPEAANILYNPPQWSYHATILCVFIALNLLAISFFRGYLKLWLRHPAFLAIIFWSTGHLISNGNLAEVTLFGSFLAFASFRLIVGLIQGKAHHFQPKPSHDFISIGVGLLLFVLAFTGHPHIIGVSIW